MLSKSKKILNNSFDQQIRISFFFILVSLSLGTRGQNYEFNLIEDSLFFFKNNEKHFYALSSPGHEKKGKKALLIFCDPGGQGIYPVKKYNDLSQGGTFYTACSYRIKNGSLDVNNKLLADLIEHLTNTYPVDKNSIFLAGFSGGSRLAAYHHIMNPKIKATIACGSGYPSGFERKAKSISNYVGLIGTQDMNLTEMGQNLVESKETHGFHLLIVFPGNHQWPEKKYFELAMKFAGLLPAKNKTSITEVQNEFISLLNQGLFLESYYNFISLKQNFPEQIPELPSHLNEISLKEKAERLYYTEKEILKNYLNSIDRIRAVSMGYNIDKMKYGWWKSEIKNIRDKIKSTESLQEKIHNERLLGFLKTNLFESAIYQAESLMNYETAIEFFELWSLTDPENPYPFLYIARNYMRLEKLKKAKKYLNLSKEKGIEKYFELESDPLIEAILSF